MDYHRLEKGLALSNPTPGFGCAVALRLLHNIQEYRARFGTASHLIEAAGALRQYCYFHESHGIIHADIKDAAEQILAEASAASCKTTAGGTLALTRDAILTTACIDLSRFFGCRHSIRHFADREVEPELLEKAITLAGRTPSVCNRQPWRAHAIFDRERIKKALARQNGNRGFEHQIKCLIVITSTQSSFVSIGERHQAYIDGGMFSMSVVYALHSLGLGTCCLNWSVERHVDAAFRREQELPIDECVIMLIAVGHLPDRLNVAMSPRKSVNALLSICK
jgi:nitroreductase